MSELIYEYENNGELVKGFMEKKCSGNYFKFICLHRGDQTLATIFFRHKAKKSVAKRR